MAGPHSFALGSVSGAGCVGGCLCLQAQGVFGSVWGWGVNGTPVLKLREPGAIPVENGVRASEKGARSL